MERTYVLGSWNENMSFVPMHFIDSNRKEGEEIKKVSHGVKGNWVTETVTPLGEVTAAVTQ